MKIYSQEPIVMIDCYVITAAVTTATTAGTVEKSSAVPEPVAAAEAVPEVSHSCLLRRHGYSCLNNLALLI